MPATALRDVKLAQLIRWRDAPTPSVAELDENATSFKPHKEKNWFKGRTVIAESTPKVREKLKQEDRRLAMTLRDMEKNHLQRICDTNLEMDKIKHELRCNLTKKTLSLHDIPIPGGRAPATFVQFFDKSSREENKQRSREKTRRNYLSRPQTAFSSQLSYSGDIIEEEVTSLDGKDPILSRQSSGKHGRRHALLVKRPITAVPTKTVQWK